MGPGRSPAGTRCIPASNQTGHRVDSRMWQRSQRHPRVRGGWITTTAIDFSPTAVAQAKAALRDLGDRLFVADFFQHDFGTSRFDLVYERTFLCALPTSLRDQYAVRVAELLRPGGILAGFFFYGEEDPDGPPFPLPPEKADALFAKSFRLRRSEKVTDSLPIFADCEKWQEWERA